MCRVLALIGSSHRRMRVRACACLYVDEYGGCRWCRLLPMKHSLEYPCGVVAADVLFSLLIS